MPSTGYTLTDDQITVRYRTPYISTALNQRDVGIMPVGVYEGFDPVPSVALTLRLNVGASGRSSAVVQSDIDVDTQVNVHIGGNVDIDLTAHASSTVVVALLLNYAYPAITTGTIEVYNKDTETVPSTACVLAEVEVPASGVIPVANISLNGRMMPFVTRGRDARPMASVLANGKLSLQQLGNPNNIAYWEAAGLVDATIQINSLGVVSPSGANVLEVVKGSAGVGAISGFLNQSIGAGIPPNRRVRVKASLWQVTPPTSGNPCIALILLSSPATVTYKYVQLQTSATGEWVNFDETFTLEDISSPDLHLIGAVFILGNTFGVSSVTYNTVSAGEAVLYLGDLDVQIEQADDATFEPVSQSIRNTKHESLTIYDGPILTDDYAHLTVEGRKLVFQSNYSSSGFVGYEFEGPASVRIQPDLSVVGNTFIEGNLSVTTIDVGDIGEATLSLGATYASDVVIGRSGKNTTIQGNLIVEGTTTSTESETVLVSDNHLYLNAGYTGTARIQGGLVVNTQRVGNVVDVTGAYTSGAITGVTVSVANYFTSGSFIQISDSEKNDGLYEVDSQIGTTLLIKTGAASPYVQNTFVPGPSDGAKVEQVNISLLLTSISDGQWQVATGDNSASISLKTIAVSGGGGGGGASEIAFYDGGGLSSSAGLYRDSGDILYLDGIRSSTAANTLTIGDDSNTVFVEIGTASGGSITLGRTGTTVTTKGGLVADSVATFNSTTLVSSTLFIQPAAILYLDGSMERSVTNPGVLSVGTTSRTTGIDLGTGTSTGPINIGSVGTTNLDLNGSNVDIYGSSSITIYAGSSGTMQIGHISNGLITFTSGTGFAFEGASANFGEPLLVTDVYPDGAADLRIGELNTNTLYLGTGVTTGVEIGAAAKTTVIKGKVDIQKVNALDGVEIGPAAFVNLTAASPASKSSTSPAVPGINHYGLHPYDPSNGVTNPRNVNTWRRDYYIEKLSSNTSKSVCVAVIDYGQRATGTGTVTITGYGRASSTDYWANEVYTFQWKYVPGSSISQSTVASFGLATLSAAISVTNAGGLGFVNIDISFLSLLASVPMIVTAKVDTIFLTN